MAINGYRLFDSDLHVIEPADLWQRYIDPRFKDRAPVGVVEQPFSTGRLYPLEGVPFSPTDKGEFTQICVEQAHMRGRYAQYCEFERRGWGPDIQRWWTTRNAASFGTTASGCMGSPEDSRPLSGRPGCRWR